jgi:DnaJ-class molecular chaperone
MSKENIHIDFEHLWDRILTTIQKEVICQTCCGTGKINDAEPGFINIKKCKYCKGTGCKPSVAYVERSNGTKVLIFGVEDNIRQCEECGRDVEVIIGKAPIICNPCQGKDV